MSKDSQLEIHKALIQGHAMGSRKIPLVACVDMYSIGSCDWEVIKKSKVMFLDEASIKSVDKYFEILEKEFQHLVNR